MVEQKIAAVVVTYNRRDYLKQCLSALDRQSQRPDLLLVVDNSSTDGTPEVLAGLAYPGLEVHRLSTNTGGAGGFAFGIEKALEAGADWIWLMDDDAEPTPDCLEQLWKARAMVGEKVLCPLIVGESGPQFYHHKLVDPVTLLERESESIPTEPVHIHANAFVGPLFPAELARRHGLPCAKYFIWCDDLEYTYRISERGANIILVPSARILHHDKAASAADTAPWKYYYYYRNRCDFIVRHALPEHLARCKAGHLRRARKQAWRWFLERKFSYFYIPLLGILHYRLQRWGKVYDAKSFR